MQQAAVSRERRGSASRRLSSVCCGAEQRTLRGHASDVRMSADRAAEWQKKEKLILLFLSGGSWVEGERESRDIGMPSSCRVKLVKTDKKLINPNSLGLLLVHGAG